MKSKKILALLTLILVIPSLQSCNSIRKAFETGLSADVEYREFENSCTAYELTKKGREKEVVYVLDEYRGKPVTALGKPGYIVGIGPDFSSENLKKIYFPWRLSVLYGSCQYGETVEYAISASTKIIPAGITGHRFYSNYNSDKQIKFVMPLCTFELVRGGWHIDSFYYVDNDLRSDLVPANIAYFFNYNDNPNEGYFFVDLLESTGKLTKPPYDPKREGYEFDGWYVDKECTQKWNFDNDVVTINFDEEENRIYEEFCLYAKWEVEEKTQWEKLLDLFK